MSAGRRRIRFARPPRILRYSWRIFLNISPSVEQLVNSISPRLFWNSPALTQRFKYARLTCCPCPSFCSCAIETLDWSRWLPLDRFFLRCLSPVLPFVFLPDDWSPVKAGLAVLDGLANKSPSSDAELDRDAFKASTDWSIPKSPYNCSPHSWLMVIILAYYQSLDWGIRTHAHSILRSPGRRGGRLYFSFRRLCCSSLWIGLCLKLCEYSDWHCANLISGCSFRGQESNESTES